MRTMSVLLSAALAASFAVPACAQSRFDQSKYDLAGSSPALRAAAVEYFRDQHSAPADAVLMERIGSEPNAGLRARLVEAIDVNVSSAAFAFVAKLLKDPNQYVAQSAAISLGACSDSARVVPVFETAVKDKAVPARVKQAIVNALGFHVSTDSVRLLDYVAGNTGNPGEMRQLAVNSLARIGTKEAADRINLYRNDKDPRVKGEARKAAAPKKK